MNIVICDDDIFVVEQIDYLLRSYFRNTYENLKVYKYTSGKKLRESLANIKYDIAYIDIELLDDNGIEVAKQIQKSNSKSLITFVSNHNQYVSQAFTLQAFQYITKPIDEKLFNYDLSRALKTYKKFNITIPIKTKGRIFYKHPKDIVYIESYYRKVTVFTTDEAIQTTYTLNKMIELLEDYDFVQVHQSYLVNMFYIEQIMKNKVILKDGNIVSLSPYKYELVLKIFNSYLNGESKL